MRSEPPAERALPDTDATLIARSVKQPRVFGRVFDRHWPAIHAFCTSRAGAVGEDLAAEAFRIAFDERRRFDSAYGDARPWLFGIATNLLRRHFRTAERGRRAEAATAVADVDHLADDALGRIEAERLAPELAAALASIPAADRDALLLVAWAGLSYEQVAVAMDVPVGTVRSRLNRARTRVRAHLIKEEAR